MQIRQFEKLHTLIKEAVDQLIKLKLENKSLLQKNEELRKQIEKNSQKSDKNLTEELRKLRAENRNLQNKHQVISSRLSKVLARVKDLGEGVES